MPSDPTYTRFVFAFFCRTLLLIRRDGDRRGQKNRHSKRRYDRRDLAARLRRVAKVRGTDGCSVPPLLRATARFLYASLARFEFRRGHRAVGGSYSTGTTSLRLPDSTSLVSSHLRDPFSLFRASCYVQRRRLRRRRRRCRCFSAQTRKFIDYLNNRANARSNDRAICTKQRKRRRLRRRLFRRVPAAKFSRSYTSTKL